MGHQHVLEPALRTPEGAKSFAQHLLAHAAERMRRKDYFCCRLSLSLWWLGDLGSWYRDVRFQETDDTGFLLKCLEELWTEVPRFKPLSVGVTLSGLVPAARHQLDLFMESQTRSRLSPVIDRINRRFGRDVVTFGLVPPAIRAFTGHAAFSRVPEGWEFQTATE